MNRVAFEIQIIFTNFTFIVWKNTKFPFPWFEITLTRQLTLHKLAQIKKIENDLLLLEAVKHHFFIGQKVAVKLMLDIVIIITTKSFLLVQFRSENVKLKRKN
jgi:hypothetical protein